MQLFQPRLQSLFRALQTFDGEAVAARKFGVHNAVCDFLDLLAQQALLPLRADGDTLKLRVADDNGIIIAGSDAGAEFLAVAGFKILFGCDKNVG